MTARTSEGSPTSPPRPALVGDSAALFDELPGDLPTGALWRLQQSPRQLDANVVHLAGDQRVETNVEPALDVLLHVLQGSGQVLTEGEPIDLHPGSLLWLPRGSQRGLQAGPDGVSYLTVHVRRPPLAIGRPPGS